MIAISTIDHLTDYLSLENNRIAIKERGNIRLKNQLCP
jgi:hypothetical protein